MDRSVDIRDPEQVSASHSAAVEFSDCLSNLEQAMRDALKAFAAYHASDAKITREQWSKWFDGEVPSQEYIDGFNAGVESVLGSVETFLEEFW